MKNMNYEVLVMKDNNDYIPFISKSHSTEAYAIVHAKKMAKEHPDKRVFITFYRRNDGQQGYINRDGAGITGKAW